MIKQSLKKLLGKKSMDLIYHPIFLEHETGDYPENKKRLLSFGRLPEQEIPSGEAFLSLVHKADYLQQVKDKSLRNEALNAETPSSPRSYEVALKAVGAAVLAADNQGFALLRPPGHHAYPHRSSGFCFFNNVAIAAQYLVEQGKRVAILDFDGHHGDGTEFTFYNTDEVLTLSIHQFPAFPHETGWYDRIGRGAGKGFNINVPLPPQSGDDIFQDVLHSFIPYLEKFQPDVLAISAGFDSHEHDFLLDLRLTYRSYYKLGKLLSKKFPNTFAVLEGGYDPELLSKGVYSFIAGMKGLKMPYQAHATESSMNVLQEYELRSDSLMGLLKEYW